MLTYAALPDRQEDRTTAVELDRSGLATGVAAHAPSPPSVTVDQVISLEAARSRMQIAGELAGAGYPAEVVPALTKLVAAARQVRTEIAH